MLYTFCRICGFRSLHALHIYSPYQQAFLKCPQHLCSYHRAPSTTVCQIWHCFFLKQQTARLKTSPYKQQQTRFFTKMIFKKRTKSKKKKSGVSWKKQSC